MTRTPPVGVVELIDVLRERPADDAPVASVMRAAVVIPTSMLLPVALDRMRRSRNELACVVDEYGNFDGILTIEDLTEEVIGELSDEHDVEVAEVSADGDDAWTVPGDLHLDELERLIGYDLAESDVETVAGLVIETHGDLPPSAVSCASTFPSVRPRPCRASTSSAGSPSRSSRSIGTCRPSWLCICTRWTGMPSLPRGLDDRRGGGPMNGWTVALITTALIIASAFFVIVEFALLAARRHRLEEQAATSASARAALRGVNELTVMLAFAQLGITACTFLLGAITKPAIDYALAPVFEAWGLPYVLADIIAFMLALIVVTFLHLVIGEMAPKSWAIAHPETAAKATGILARALTWPLRPFLLWINHIANRLVKASGVEPVEKAAAGGQDADTIRELVAHSRQAGTLEKQYSEPIAQAIALGTLTVGDIVRTDRSPTSVPRDATVAEIQAVAASSTHLRILVGSGADSRVAHVRDTLTVDPDTPALEIAREPLVLEPSASAYDALASHASRTRAVGHRGGGRAVARCRDSRRPAARDSAGPGRAGRGTGWVCRLT